MLTLFMADFAAIHKMAPPTIASRIKSGDDAPLAVCQIPGHTMHFASDNWAGAHPEIAANIVRHSAGFAPANGGGPLEDQVRQTFCEIFETDVAVHYVGTGTAANALALSATALPGGVVFAHSEAHVRVDECGAPEFYTPGLKIEPVEGSLGQIDAVELERKIAEIAGGGLNAGQSQAISVSQLTEAGTTYTLADIAAIADIAHAHGLPVHMDGSRFANALVALGCTPAQMTWQAGIDILSFGATKNGCFCAEALVFLDPDRARQMDHLRKRSGQLFSKARFVSAQFEAYLEDGRWLALARHANAMGALVAEAIEKSSAFRLAWAPDANEVFAIGNSDAVEALSAAGIAFSPWQPPRAERHLLREDEAMIRLVASFATTTADIDALRSAMSPS